MQHFYKIIIMCAFSTVLSFGKQYVSIDTQPVKYVTVRQKKKLFNSVGCEYVNKMEIELANFDKIKPTKTDYYKSYNMTIDVLSQKYHDDVIKHTLAPMYLQWISSDVGYGIFALQDIADGDFIGVYAGQLRLVRGVNDPEAEDVDYAWYYTINAPSGKRLIIDGKYRGNELRFINHGSDPNTKLIYLLVNEIFYACYVACKFIPKDAQLTVNYGDGYWTTRNINPAAFN